MALTGDLYETIVRIVKEQVGEIKVTREDFDKLTKTVERLSEAVRELAEAQRGTEMVLSGLGQRLATLEAGMERLERAVDRLAEAQKRTEVALQELVEAQKRTDQTVRRLADTIGHDLESVARVNVPDWLRLYKGVKVSELKRRAFKVDGEEIEVDLYGEGMKGRAPTTIVGEAKSTIHGRDVEAFSSRVDRLKSQIHGRLVKVMFGYWIHPSAEQEARKMQIHVIAPPGTYSRAGRQSR